MKTATPPRPRARVRSSAPAAPPLPRHGDDAEGADVLRELPGATGVLLWGALRDVLLWVDTPAAERRGLFDYGAASERRDDIARSSPDPELWGPLLTLAEMTAAPERADPARLAYACRALCRWAERRGASGTRLAFAEAAALVQPDSPKLALEAARLARDLARYAPAEGWFRRAIRRARGSDWESYAWGFVGLGVLYMRTGNYPAAQTVVGRALRTARKRRMGAIEGAARHHLFVFAVDARRMQEAYEHAHAALRAYGDAHPRLPALAHDVGCFWIEQARFERALPIFEAVLPHLEGADRLMALANAVRAAGGSGNRPRYESARAEALRMIETLPADPVASEALAALAQGDTHMGEWARAEETCARAVALAQERGETRTLMLVEEHLAAVRDARSGASAEAEESPGLARQAERLAREIRHSLDRHAPRAAALAG